MPKKEMKGVISNFRRSRHRTYRNQMIIHVFDIKTKEEAEKLIGRKVIWKSEGNKTIEGIVKATHGNSGALRVIFNKGMPGQALGTKVKIV